MTIDWLTICMYSVYTVDYRGVAAPKKFHKFMMVNFMFHDTPQVNTRMREVTLATRIYSSSQTYIADRKQY